MLDRGPLDAFRAIRFSNVYYDMQISETCARSSAREIRE